MTNHSPNTEQRELEAAAKAHNGDRKPKFGDSMRNPWAGETNPQRDGYFVRSKRVTGRFNPGLWYEMTDGQGKFWEINGSVALFREEAARATQAAPASPEPASDFHAFKEWAGQHLGQGYSLDMEEGTLVNPVTRWAFIAFKAGSRRAPASPNTGAVPDGWQLVPKVPTPGMLAVYKEFHRQGRGYMDISVYKAMLAATPATPSPGKGGEELDSGAASSTVSQLSSQSKGGEADSAAEGRDAARYRWLREKRDIPHGARNIPWVVALDPAQKMHTMTLRAGSELDAAIDAAMQPTTGKEA